MALFSRLDRPRSILLATAISAPALTALLLVWALSFHSTAGFFRVIRPAQAALVLAILLSLIPAVLTGIAVRLQTNTPAYGRLVRPAAILAAIFISLPLTGFSYFGSYYLNQTGDRPVQLLVIDGMGKDKVPDIAVAFWTAQPTLNTLQWNTGTSGGNLSEVNPTRSHYFILRDLPQDTEVTYQINSGRTWRFHTPKIGGALRFAVASDAHFGAGDNRPDLTASMLRHIADPKNRFSLFLFAGDLVEHGYSDAHWAEALSTLTACTSTVPLLLAAGNHDTIMDGLKRFEKYTTPHGLTDPLWRRVDFGDVHFLILDRRWNDDSIPPERRIWLERELASIPPSEWTVVVSHAYYYASGGVYGWYPWYDDRTAIRELVPLFEKYDVDLVFSGHNHQMELLKKNGVTYVICGAFGGIPDPPRTYTSPASIWYAHGRYGFVEVTIGKKAELIFRSPEGSAIETFIIDP